MPQVVKKMNSGQLYVMGDRPATAVFISGISLVGDENGGFYR
jgi:hypothetical protein